MGALKWIGCRRLHFFRKSPKHGFYSLPFKTPLVGGPGTWEGLPYQLSAIFAAYSPRNRKKGPKIWPKSRVLAGILAENSSKIEKKRLGRSFFSIISVLGVFTLRFWWAMDLTCSGNIKKKCSTPPWLDFGRGGRRFAFGPILRVPYLALKS